MKIKINGTVIDKWSSLSVSLKYASVASTFSFDLYFDPWNKTHREIMLPGAYNEATVISDSGEVLITGTLLSPAFESGATSSLVSIGGYSKTGVLDDCNYLEDGNGILVFPKQNDNKSLLAIAQEICYALGLTVSADKVVSNDVGAAYTKTDPDDGESCAEYLSRLARQKNVILSHDHLGNLLLTRSADAAAIFDFTSGMPGIKWGLTFDGQNMHSKIYAKLQGGKSTSQTATNPYVQVSSHVNYTQSNSQGLERVAPKMTGSVQFDRGNRPTAFIQTTGGDDNTTQTALQTLAKELSGIVINGKMHGWVLAGKIVRPNSFITITDPYLYLFNKTKLFIESVDFTGTANEETCVLNVVVPEVYNGKVPINIFTDKGNNTNYKDAPKPDPGSALIGGFAGQNKIIDL